MATTNVNILTDKAIKDQAEEIDNELDFDMTTSAIEEGRKMMKVSSSPRYSSIDALKEALDV